MQAYQMVKKIKAIQQTLSSGGKEHLYWGEKANQKRMLNNVGSGGLGGGNMDGM